MSLIWRNFRELSADLDGAVISRVLAALIAILYNRRNCGTIAGLNYAEYEL
jgi:hypothetical protein